MDNDLEKKIELEKEKELKREKELKKVNKHLYKLWSLSKYLYVEGDYPTASFFAITLIVFSNSIMQKYSLSCLENSITLPLKSPFLRDTTPKQ